jgi:hypothetical protein
MPGGDPERRAAPARYFELRHSAHVKEYPYA